MRERSRGALGALQLALCSLASCSSPVTPASEQPLLLIQPQGPGVYESKSALVGMPFPVEVYALTLPSSNCGIAQCVLGRETLSAVSAECEGDACTAMVTDGLEGVPTFSVTPNSPGQTVLHVRIHGSSGRDYTDTLPMTFVSSAHLEVHGSPLEGDLLNRVKYASLPGCSLEWQITLEAEDGLRLAAYASEVQASVQGSAYALGENPHGDASKIILNAMAPGTSLVNLTLGATVRAVSLSVIDPSDVAAAEFHALDQGTTQPVVEQTLEGPDVFASDSSASVSVKALLEPARWAVVLRTTSGALAIGGASKLRVVPEELGQVSSFEDGWFSLWSGQSSMGMGKLLGSIGGASVSVPVVVTPN